MAAVVDGNMGHGCNCADVNLHDDGNHDGGSEPSDCGALLRGNSDDVRDDGVKADCHVVSPERAISLLRIATCC
jgi:hypothetical protein